MNIHWKRIGLLVLSQVIFVQAGLLSAKPEPIQYIIFNRAPGLVWSQSRPQSITPESMMDIRTLFPDPQNTRVRVGVSFVLSYLATPDSDTIETLNRLLDASSRTNTPILIKLDGENWWSAAPELWNWWDPNLPGYNPENRKNVEWTGWSSDQAIRIAWRNWGRQIRVLPPPNLFSRSYRLYCKDKMFKLLPIIQTWWKNLPPEKQYLFIGINIGWESSIGVNAWYYPNGNDLLDQDPSKDPQTGLNPDDVPSRGQVQIGYASLRSSGFRVEGQITEEDLARVVKRHLSDLCLYASTYHIPRDKIFTHCGGWKEGEMLYQSAVNYYSCPGWSFYRHADDPARDAGVQNALQLSNAPYWAAAEWLLQKPYEVTVWKSAMDKFFADPRCRFVCVYNWEGIADKPAVLEAVRQVCNMK